MELGSRDLKVHTGYHPLQSRLFFPQTVPRSQRPLDVHWNVEFIVRDEFQRFDVPFAPPNLLILLNGTGFRYAFCSWCCRHALRLLVPES